MAAGSQKWNGMIADLAIAPIRMRTTAATIAPGGVEFAVIGATPSVPALKESMSSTSEYEPPGMLPSVMRPMSMASPPSVVVIKAWLAARREDRFS